MVSASSERPDGRRRTLLAALAFPLAFLAVLPAVLVALPFWVMTGLTTAVRRVTNRLRRQADPWQSIIEFAPVVGWRNRSRLRGRALIQGGSFGFVTDADGWRGAGALADADVVVFGDSFAFGHGAEEEDYFGNLHPDVAVKGIGANGYNTVQAVQWMERLMPSLPDRFVVLFVYYGNDLEDSLLPSSLNGYRMPFARRRPDTGAWEISSDHVRLEPWPFPIRQPGSKLAVLCCDVPRARRAYSALEFLVGRARDLCADVGARLVVMGVPDPRQLRAAGRRSLASVAPDPATFDADRPDHELRAICERVGLRFVALSEHLAAADYLTVDCHWTPRGHRRVSEVVVREYRQARSAPAGKEARIGDGVVPVPSPASVAPPPADAVASRGRKSG